jgi:hypothetical protein
MAETDLLEAVTDMCDELWIRWAHIPDSRYRAGTPGFPDLVMAGHRIAFRELKSGYGTVSPAQRQWLSLLAAAGADAGVWTPEDLDSGRIRAELEAIRLRSPPALL